MQVSLQNHAVTRVMRTAINNIVKYITYQLYYENR